MVAVLLTPWDPSDGVGSAFVLAGCTKVSGVVCVDVVAGGISAGVVVEVVTGGVSAGVVVEMVSDEDVEVVSDLTAEMGVSCVGGVIPVAGCADTAVATWVLGLKE